MFDLISFVRLQFWAIEERAIDSTEVCEVEFFIGGEMVDSCMIFGDSWIVKSDQVGSKTTDSGLLESEVSSVVIAD